MRGWWQRLGRSGRSTSPRQEAEEQGSQVGVPSIEDLVRSIDEGLAQRDRELAAKTIEQALIQHPKSPALLMRQARLVRLQGNPTLARAQCDALICLDIDAAEVHFEMALCDLSVPDLSTALDSLHVALSHNPDHPEALFRLGETLLRLDRYGEAVGPLAKAVQVVDPSRSAQAYFLHGEALRLTGDLAQAMAAYRACVAANPQHMLGHIALGHASLLVEEEIEALAHYDAAASLNSKLPTNVRLNMASILQNFGQIDRAHDILKLLHAERPDDHAVRWYLAQLDLLQCRWKAGWANYPARFGAGASPYRPMPYRPWHGEPIDGETLLVLADQGLGDEIMFASCFREARAKAAHCIVECEPRLLRLFERSMPDIHFVATQRENDTRWLEGLPSPRWQVTSGDLPALFRQDDAAFGTQSPYLFADPLQVSHWRRKLRNDLGEGLTVGISWRGGTAKTRTLARTLALQAWAPILRVPGARFVNLQYGRYANDLRELEAMHGVPVVDYPEIAMDYDATAALVGALDLVVTVCTAVVHLAGALGTPVWVLCPHVPGWRYTADRTQIPWYPSSRLFRQSHYGGWDAACHDVSSALEELTKSVTRTHLAK